MHEWIAFTNERPGDQRHFAVNLGGPLAGGAGFSHLGDLNTRTAEIGYWIGEPWWGRGVRRNARQARSQCGPLSLASVQVSDRVEERLKLVPVLDDEIA